VESEEQSKILSELGCDFAQGAHWNPPVPAEELAKKLN
jgi:EAL domain-containing protein (putative c-di-GMP-specific phosphodiesterase class I)